LTNQRASEPRSTSGSSGLSTRLGTALRHAGELISHARSFRKLVIVLTTASHPTSTLPIRSILSKMHAAPRSDCGRAASTDSEWYWDRGR